MISKIFAWIMAVLAALFSGNSLHTQEPQVYQGVPGYEINAPLITMIYIISQQATRTKNLMFVKWNHLTIQVGR